MKEDTNDEYDRVIDYLSRTAPKLASELDEIDLAVDLPEVPNYTAVKRIGCGGFGDVWLVQNTLDLQYYAMKTLKDGRESELAAIREFKRRIPDHPHLVPIGHVGEVEGTIYYLMPLADNALPDRGVRKIDDYEPMTLREFVNRHGEMSASEVKDIAVGLLGALGAMHSAGGVHRDVKPLNILLFDGVWRLSDPGLMSLCCDDSPIAGTKRYRRSDAQENDISADIYALAVTLEQVYDGCDVDPSARRLQAALLRAKSDGSQRFPSTKHMDRFLQDKDQDQRRRRVGCWFSHLLLAVLAFTAGRGLRPASTKSVDAGANAHASSSSVPMQKNIYYVEASADAFVMEDDQDINLGAASELVVRTRNADREAYLRFFLPDGVDNRVPLTRATLRLWARSYENAPGKLVVHGTSDHWIEKQVSWSSKPDVGSRIGDVSVLGTYGYVEVDVTDYVNDQLRSEDRKISFAIQAAGSGHDKLIHAQAPQKHAPTLILQAPYDLASRINIPQGYTLMFYSNFDQVSIDQVPVGNDWWYVPRGNAFGFDWADMEQLTGAEDLRLRIQTMVSQAENIDAGAAMPDAVIRQRLAHYQSWSLPQEGVRRKKVLRFNNKKSKTDDKLSRMQLVSPVTDLEGVFVEFDVYFPRSLRDVLQRAELEGTAPNRWKHAWNCFSGISIYRHEDAKWDREFSMVLQKVDRKGKNPNSASKEDPYGDYYLRARLLNAETGESGINQFKSFGYNDWDKWHKVQMLVEANASQSVASVWFDGEQICESIAYPHEGEYLGDKLDFLQPIRLSISRRMQEVGNGEATCRFDRLKIFKKTN